MIKIADNPIVRDQVATVAQGHGDPKTAGTPGEAQPRPPAYPAKQLVLENGRYHVANSDK